MNRKYQLGTEENKDFLKRIREGLFRFGEKYASPQGSAYYLGDDGTPWKDRPRETWITSRMAHVYCLDELLGNRQREGLADAAIQGLLRELHDDKNGGWYTGLTSQGVPLPQKQCYAHAFVILAASSGLLAQKNGAEELLQMALDLYDLRFWDEEKGLSCDTWNTEFTILEEYRGLNANMHTVEAFLAAADATGKREYTKRAGRIIDHVIGWASGNQWRIPEHFTKSWTPQLQYNESCPEDPFKPYGATPGHGIEWARLIIQWASSALAKENRASYMEASQLLYHRAISDAWNCDGAPGLVYTTDWDGRPIVHDRMHWTLAEAINTSAVLYQATGKAEYSRDYESFMQYLDTFVLDHEKGSWFHQLNKDNQVVKTVWPGKPDLYHAVQATLIPCYRFDLSIAAAVKEKMVTCNLSGKMIQ
ncbi:Uncharacterized sugar isomerase yihS [Blautia hydrogenotrophica]|uniref:AGE family epimerase/isomerase n=1 Tax=Blautia hydrogenotrophica TaxID=53443 RepID=UPI0006BFE594|nr:AGE family epimerase/isomerase [Blautia hydrogenotrophica]CUM69100.1 Uncharacterized sugar isomerase yihS [Blautia hydrogenotrophica]SCI18222.1 Uncharacterized sugar isomerase yihS [uncultured Blautia sp.]